MTSGFLARMAEASRERVRRARSERSEAALLERALATRPPPALRLHGFDIIAELKLRSPASGGLAARDFDRRAQLTAYAQAGAAAISVLTEPDEFRGRLEHVVEAATIADTHHRPVMRKDFLTDPYQVLEARAAGAGGVLVIVTMLDDAQIAALLDCARELSLFVLLEAFDRADLERIAELGAGAAPGSTALLAGVNCRDLRTLDVEPRRFAELAQYLPAQLPAVAESGIESARDVRELAELGYSLALVGSSLMRAPDSGEALAGLIAAGRAGPEA